MTDEELDNVANAAVKELLATGPMSPQRFHEAAKATRRALFNAGAAKAESRVRELEAERGARISVEDYDNVTRMLSAEQGRTSDLYHRLSEWQKWGEALVGETKDSTEARERIAALAADSSAALAKAREALEAYEAARSGSIDEHDAFVELRAALATQTPAEQDGRVAAVRRVADGPHPDTITVISDDHDHYYVPASALVDAQERIAELEALAGQDSGSHDVQWLGVFRGTEEDPREVGWCQRCKREVYDNDGAGHRITVPAEPEPEAPAEAFCSSPKVGGFSLHDHWLTLDGTSCAPQLMQPAEPEKP